MMMTTTVTARTELRITGLGGQGAITIGHLLGRAATLYDNKEAAVTEGYSPYVTGGWSRADVIISKTPIDYPAVSRLDVLMTMYQEGLDLNLNLLKPDGTILVENRLVDCAKVVAQRRRVVQIPALEIAEKLGKGIVANVVMLGALVGSTGVVSLGSTKKALADRFPKNIELNGRALDSGVNFVSAALNAK